MSLVNNFQLMEARRERLYKDRQANGFRFEVGELVDVFDHGMCWEARVRRIITNATDKRLRYQCTFKGHRQWDEVCYFFVLKFSANSKLLQFRGKNRVIRLRVCLRGCVHFSLLCIIIWSVTHSTSTYYYSIAKYDSVIL